MDAITTISPEQDASERVLALHETLPTREQIVKLQNAMVSVQCEQPDPVHHFAKGMYLRELTVPAGMMIVGKLHKHEHFLMVLKGRAAVVSEFGKTIVEAGYIAVSPPGVKRVVLAIEDTQFVTVHLNLADSRDLVQVEADHIEPEILSLPDQKVEGELT